MKASVCTFVVSLAAGIALADGRGLDAGRAWTAELMADTEMRASALADHQPLFAPRIGGQIMFRYIVNSAADVPEEDDTALGFQTRRTKLSLRGNIINDRWDYQILTAFSRSTGAPTIENVYIRHRFDEGWWVTAGQFKLPFLREENISSTRQLAADRSAMNVLYTQGFSQGVEIGTGGRGEDTVRMAGAFSDGLGSRNLDFDSKPADYALTGRIEYRIAGEWEQFQQFTSFPRSGFGALIGTALHWQAGGQTFGTPDVDILSATVDAGLVGDGWHGHAAGVWRSTDPAGEPGFDDFGVLLQGGVFIGQNTELFGRWDAILADGDRPVGDFHVLTAGINHYLSPQSHAAKFTVDVQYLLDAPTESLTPSGGGMRGLGLNPADTDDGQWAIRAQMQILF